MKLLKYYNKTIILTLIILFLSLARFDNIAHELKFEYEDKVIHFLMYFGITVVFLFEHYIIKSRISKKDLIINIYPIFLGGIIEIIQAKFTTTRTGDWYDFLADISGIIIANILFPYIKDIKIFDRILRFPGK
ncbi:MAG: hypothetical protein GXO47_06540 [Chlorobi bacterium]|nr:hypothetical protein [Chlorobiota bacterium]